jgi:hypothetical protein
VLRNASSVDHVIDGNTMLGHTLKNDARMEGRAFNCGKQLILRGMNEVPAERDAPQLGIY